MAFCCAVEPDAVSVPEPLQVIPLAATGAALPELLGAEEDGVELLLELLDPQAPTARIVLAASATDPYWLQRRVERPTVLRPPRWRDGPPGRVCHEVTLRAGS